MNTGCPCGLVPVNWFSVRDKTIVFGVWMISVAKENGGKEMRLIDADALRKYVNDKSTHLLNEWDTVGVLMVVDKQPTIDPDSLRPKGQWIGEADGYADGELVYDVWYCSECNHCIDDGTDDPAQLPNFCPHCGADMRENK